LAGSPRRLALGMTTQFRGSSFYMLSKRNESHGPRGGSTGAVYFADDLRDDFSSSTKRRRFAALSRHSLVICLSSWKFFGLITQIGGFFRSPGLRPRPLCPCSTFRNCSSFPSDLVGRVIERVGPGHRFVRSRRSLCPAGSGRDFVPFAQFDGRRRGIVVNCTAVVFFVNRSGGVP